MVVTTRVRLDRVASSTKASSERRRAMASSRDAARKAAGYTAPACGTLKTKGIVCAEGSVTVKGGSNSSTMAGRIRILVVLETKQGLGSV